MIPIKELKDGDSISTMYAVRSKEAPREYRNKEGRYFFFNVGDRSGDITVKFWGGPDIVCTMATYNSIIIGNVVEISGEVEYDRYSEGLTIKMSEDQHTVRVCGESEYDVAEFLPRSQKDLDALYSKLLERMANVENPDLRHLLSLFLNDEKFAETLRTTPASVTHNHNYIGGHLEHTYNVIRICDLMADSYPELDRDLLVSAAMLYDVGKIRGYEFTASVDVSDEGQFLGHVYLSHSIVKDKLDQIEDFPRELALKLMHLIITHHGDSEKGSTKRFRIPEACALHNADALDAQVNAFLSAVENEEDTGDWPYSRRLGHAIYRGSPK